MAKLYINIFVTFHLCLILMHPLPSSSSSSTPTNTYNVLKLGAKPNGIKDTTKHFLNAWQSACNSKGRLAKIVVPKGRYLLHPITLDGGNCTSNHITFHVKGTLVAPLDFRALGKAYSWLDFHGVTGVSIIGDGTLDAKGSSLWACKMTDKNGHCPSGATTLSFTGSNNIVIRGIRSLNSQLFHIVINGCKSVHVEGVKIRAPGKSPNTDGIHVQHSMDVTIKNSVVKTGDDCISIGPGTKNLWIERVACGPSHGISIGSLAKDHEEEGVQNVTAKTIVVKHSTSGVRIKSWARPSKGFVRGVLFQDVLMHHVWNPIIIDQNYCPHNQNCPTQESGVSIRDVVYKDIRGISETEIAVKFDCSSSDPCKGIKLQNINLKYHSGASQSYCKNAIGKAFGIVRPKSCLA